MSEISESTSPRFRRVALVEENLMFSMMVEPALKRLGCEVRTLSGPGLVERLAEWAPDLVLVNLASTRAGGAELVREVRSHPGTAKIPVVGYAGHVERELLQAGRDAGADLVVPNSALRASLPEVIAKLERRLTGGEPEDWPPEA